jgi:hypothetical protein
MKHLKIVGLCLTAMFVLSMVATGGASALPAQPYFEQCQKTAEPNVGEYSNSACSETTSPLDWIDVVGGETECRETEPAGKGNFKNAACTEALAGGNFIKIAEPIETFSSEGGAGKLETVTGKTVVCTGNTDRGRISGPKEVAKVFVTFVGCEETTKKVKCKTTGKAEGEVETLELKGHLGFLNATKVGLVLEPSAGTLFAELLCPSTIFKIKVNGKVIGEVTSALNTLSKTGVLHYTTGSEAGKQAWTKFEGGAEEILKSTFSGGNEEQSAIIGQDELKFQDYTQIKG